MCDYRLSVGTKCTLGYIIVSNLVAAVRESQLNWSTQDLLPEEDGDCAIAEMAVLLCVLSPEGVRATAAAVVIL